MKKKLIIIIAIVCAIVLIGAAAVTICLLRRRGNEESAQKAKIIDIDASEAAKTMYTELMESGDAEVLEEGTFDYIVAALYERGEQKVPETETTNRLASFRQDDTTVLTLGEDDCEKIVLYIHGGAWTFEIDDLHVAFCDRIATAMQAKVYMPLYPLAPQSTCDETYAMIYKLYSQIAAGGKEIYVMGDSAGGNITLGLVHLLKEKGDALPCGIVTISPCVDMTFSNTEMEEVEKSDPSLRIYGAKTCATLWAGEKSLSDPLLSPINADVSGYPKTLIFYGTNDIVYPDGLEFYEKMAAAGENVTLVRAEGLFHVFPIYELPERDFAISKIAEFCK